MPPILSHVLPVERIVAATPLVYAGQFRCAPTDPLFAGGRPCSSFCIVFPREPTWIQHDGGPRFVADAGMATLYNQGQAYRRWSIGRRPDRCDWLAFGEHTIREVVASADAKDATSATRPFRFGFTPVTASLYLAQRRLFEALERGAVNDITEVEEQALTLLGAVVRRAYASRHAAATRGSTTRRAREAIEHVRQLIARGPQERAQLGDLAAAAGLSPFHLCREFRIVTGTTITAYRTELRVRAALERIAAGEDLTSVALSLGFVSHSHFTHAFRRVFGVVPSATRTVRDGLRRSGRTGL